MYVFGCEVAGERFCAFAASGNFRSEREMDLQTWTGEGDR